MKNTNVITNGSSLRTTRILSLSILGLASLLMFSLALTASAATLTRQLELGMRGQDVSDLQTFLATDATIYPQGLVTGYFGFLTKAAVSNFQSRNGIASVGRVGPITMAAINAQMNSGVGGSDRYAPTISSLNVNATNNTVTMSWNTNENSVGTVYYSSSPIPMTEATPTSDAVIGGTSFSVNSNLQVTHSGTITGLNSNTTYYYVVSVKDASGNENITWPSTFHTN